MRSKSGSGELGLADPIKPILTAIEGGEGGGDVNVIMSAIQEFVLFHCGRV